MTLMAPLHCRHLKTLHSGDCCTGCEHHATTGVWASQKAAKHWFTQRVCEVSIHVATCRSAGQCSAACGASLDTLVVSAMLKWVAEHV